MGGPVNADAVVDEPVGDGGGGLAGSDAGLGGASDKLGGGATVVVVVGTTVVPPPSQNCSHATRTVCPSYPSAFGALSLQHPQNAVNATQSSRIRCHFPIPGSGNIGPGANTLNFQVQSPRHPPGIVVTVVGVAVVVEVVVVVVVTDPQGEYQ